MYIYYKINRLHTHTHTRARARGYEECKLATQLEVRSASMINYIYIFNNIYFLKT